MATGDELAGKLEAALLLVVVLAKDDCAVEAPAAAPSNEDEPRLETLLRAVMVLDVVGANGLTAFAGAARRKMDLVLEVPCGLGGCWVVVAATCSMDGASPPGLAMLITCPCW